MCIRDRCVIYVLIGIRTVVDSWTHVLSHGFFSSRGRRARLTQQELERLLDVAFVLCERRRRLGVRAGGARRAACLLYTSDAAEAGGLNTKSLLHVLRALPVEPPSYRSAAAALACEQAAPVAQQRRASWLAEKSFGSGTRFESYRSG